MSTFLAKTLSILGLIFIPQMSMADLMEGQVFLSKLSEAKSILVKRNNQTFEYEAGHVITPGDAFQTNENVSAEVTYPDGTQIIIAPRSEIVVEGIVDSVDWVKIKYGTIRGIIPPSPAVKPPKFKFILRTPFVSLGTRDGNFILASKNNLSSPSHVHVVEGSVEIAPSELNLLDGKGTRINDGQFLDISGKKIGPIGAFNPLEYLKTLDPSITRLSNMAR